MIYERLRTGLLALLRAPLHPPDPPAGSPASVRTFRAAPNFLVYELLVWGMGFAGATLAELIFIVAEGVAMASERGSDRPGAMALGSVLLGLTLAGAVAKYFLIRLGYDMRYYVVTDRSLRIREGALIINESTYTFANVQNLKIHQGPLERLLGIANLVVETAGGAGGSREKRQRDPFGRGHEGVLRGIVDAREVRDQILHLLKRYRDAGLGDPEDARRAAAPGPAPAGGGLPPAAIERLREIRAELRALRDATR